MAIESKKLVTYIDFQLLQKGDVLAMEFHRNQYDKKGNSTRFIVAAVEIAKHESSEIIFDKKMNRYFNYAMFCDPKENGNLKECLLISQIETVEVTKTVE